MAMSKNLLKIFNYIWPFRDFLYILQLEEYETGRYFNRLKYFFWRRNLERRGSLVFTKRIKITFLAALPLSIVTPPLTPFWIGLANAILTPYFENIKLGIQSRAAKYFKKHGKSTLVIAIAGSYGKTTTKNFIYELVRYNYKTQMTPGNINTPTGIANWVLEKFNQSTEVLIIEADAYFIGEIGRSLTIVPPDIAVLTNVGDQHLERFGSKKNLEKALKEVFSFAKPDAIKISDKKSSLDYALEVAKILKIPNDIVADTVKRLTPPERRGNTIDIDGYEVIDQSYNISEETAKKNVSEAKTYAKKANKKLIVITAGIPELGEENKDGNKNLGKLLDKDADATILLKSILYEDVEKGINDKEKIFYASNMNVALEKLKTFDNKKYLVLMLPELNDLYYL